MAKRPAKPKNQDVVAPISFIRSPVKATGGITPEERSRIGQHAQLWRSRLLRTDPIKAEKIDEVIGNLYLLAGLRKPRVVIASSPLAMVFAYGAAAALIYRKKKAITHDFLDAPPDGTCDNTGGDTMNMFTRRTILAATCDVACDVIDAENYAASYAAVDTTVTTAPRSAASHGAYHATRDETRAIARAATSAAARTTHAAARAPRDATRAARAAAALDAATATRAAIYNATRSGIDADHATRAAARAATHDLTRTAIQAATRDAVAAFLADSTDDATCTAIYAAIQDIAFDIGAAAIHSAIKEATDKTFHVAARAATRTRKRAPVLPNGAAQACYSLAGRFGLACARENVSEGGNMLSSYDCYLTAMRDIIGLRSVAIDQYGHWEAAAINGSFRMMHEEFCIVSDFPEFIRVDQQNRPHCGTGPSHRWRDGWSLYHWHGVKVPAEWIEDPSSLTAQIALTWRNIEQRRCACEILGWATILRALDARLIDRDADPEIGELVEVNLPGSGKEKFLRLRCGTGRQFALPVPPTMETALQANAWTYGFDDYTAWLKPEVRT